MTCKDCLHYEACNRLNTKTIEAPICGCGNKYFSDKSEWYHFRGTDCKTAYFTIGYGNSAQVVEEPIYGWGIKNGNQCVIDKYGCLYEIGGIVFLTKEEAQKELERRRKLK